jgi:hypothetical protein
MKALLISANSSDPVKEINFNEDELWKWEVARRHGEDVLLTKRNAERDYLLRNSLATRLDSHLASLPVKADAERDPTSTSDFPKELCGDVIVAYYDRALDKVSGLTEHQLTSLTRSIHLIAPTTRVEGINGQERVHGPGKPRPLRPPRI